MHRIGPINGNKFIYQKFPPVQKRPDSPPQAPPAPPPASIAAAKLRIAGLRVEGLSQRRFYRLFLVPLRRQQQQAARIQAQLEIEATIGRVEHKELTSFGSHFLSNDKKDEDNGPEDDSSRDEDLGDNVVPPDADEEVVKLPKNRQKKRKQPAEDNQVRRSARINGADKEAVQTAVVNLRKSKRRRQIH